MPDLPGLWSLSPLGALLGVLVLSYWLLVSGRLVSRNSHERELAMSNKRGDEWKETALSGRSLIEAQKNQINALIEANRIADHFFRSMEQAPPNSGGKDAVA